MDPIKQEYIHNLFSVLPLDVIRNEILARLEPWEIICFFLASREHLSWVTDLGFECVYDLLTTRPITTTTKFNFEDAYDELTTKRTPETLKRTRVPWTEDKKQVLEHYTNFYYKDSAIIPIPPEDRTNPDDHPDLNVREQPAARIGDLVYYEMPVYKIPYPFIKKFGTREPVTTDTHVPYSPTVSPWPVWDVEFFPRNLSPIYWTYYAYAIYLWSCSEATGFYTYGVPRLQDYILDGMPRLLNTSMSTGAFCLENISNGDRVFLKFYAPRQLARRKINDHGHYDTITETHMDMEFNARMKKPRVEDIHLQMPTVPRLGSLLAIAIKPGHYDAHFCWQQTAPGIADMYLHDLTNVQKYLPNASF